MVLSWHLADKNGLEMIRVFIVSRGLLKPKEVLSRDLSARNPLVNDEYLISWSYMHITSSVFITLCETTGQRSNHEALSDHNGHFWDHLMRTELGDRVFVILPATPTLTLV